MHTIRLINAVFFAHHGVSSEEQQVGGRYEVDVSVNFNFEAAAKEDALDQTVNYEYVYSIVDRVFTGTRFRLIERLAYMIANQVWELSARIEYVEVAVRKRNPSVGGAVDCAEVIYRRSAHDLRTRSDR